MPDPVAAPAEGLVTDPSQNLHREVNSCEEGWGAGEGEEQLRRGQDGCQVRGRNSVPENLDQVPLAAGSRWLGTWGLELHGTEPPEQKLW